MICTWRPISYSLLRARPKAERVLLRVRENTEYERPAGRPWSRFSEAYNSGTESPMGKRSSLVGTPISLLPCMGPMPNHASIHCGTWRVLPGGCHKCSACCFSVTAGPIALKFGMQLGDPLVSLCLCSIHGWGISARAHVQRYPHTALLYLRNGLTDCVQIWYVGWGSLAKCLPQVIGGVHLHVRTCAPLSHKCSACRHSVTVGPIALKFGMHLETD